MRRFVTYTLLFALFIGCTLVAGEYIVRTLPNSYKYKHQWMLENCNEVEYLIMGSSHTYYGILPAEFFPHSFNIANVSQNPEYDFLLLKKYLPLCKNLHTVILPISYFTFFDKPFEEGSEWSFAINYKLYMAIDKHSNLSKYNFELSNRPVYSGKLLSFLRGKEMPMCDSLGFGVGYRVNKKAATWKYDAQYIAQRHTAENSDEFEGNMNNVRNVAQFCKENNLRLILVTTPTAESYYTLLNKEQLKKTNYAIENVCKEYSLSYYNYLTDERFTDDDFYDGDHLSDIGAKKFTAILKEELSKEQLTEEAKND